MPGVPLVWGFSFGWGYSRLRLWTLELQEGKCNVSIRWVTTEDASPFRLQNEERDTDFSTLRAADGSRAVTRQLRSGVNQHCWLQVG